jgi:uncharacterized sulfatase
MFLTVRLYEIFLVTNFSNYISGSLTSQLVGFKYDLIWYLRISACLMAPYLIIAYFSQRAAKNFFVAVSIFVVLCDILMVKYFATARVPIGADILGYSFNEMMHAIKISGESRIFPYVLILIYLALMLRVFINHVYFRMKPWLMAVLTVLMLCSLVPLKQFNPEPSKFDGEFNMFVAYNKIGFFSQSLSEHYFQQGKTNDEHFTFKTIPSSAEGNPFTYLSPDYPFLHAESTPDILGQYFNLGSTPPNIVLIIVESLGRAYSGEGAYLGSFTPFLDSLMGKSLYWENCLSSSGRTFQVLPTTLASLPFGNHGFAELGSGMPDHVSLISLLRNQAGYKSTFTYGGEVEFDKMDLFLQRQGVDKIIDIKDFGPGYSKIPAMGNGFTWGYGDLEIFRRHLEYLKSAPDSLRLDILMTLAMHDPFQLPDQGSWERKFEDRLGKLNLTEKTRRFDLQYSRQLATVCYFDESLRYLISEYSKLSSFANTIFIITGDHRMPEIPLSTQIDRFHVPLVIYSPLLKQGRKFSAVSTHFDLAPSIIAMMSGRNYISRPQVAAWLGHGLDDHESFRNLNTYPLMRNTNELLDLVSSENFLSKETLYQVNPGMDIEPVEKPEIQQQLKEELDNFIRKNNYACRNNRLIPDSLKRYNLSRPGGFVKAGEAIR